LLILLLFLNPALQGQILKGKIIDIENSTALAYANIGVVDRTLGTISDENGEFILDTSALPANAVLRVTMIGYEAKSFSPEELKGTFQTIALVRKPVVLEEVSVAWKNKYREIGNTKVSYGAGVCGWGGTDFGKGHELGILLDLGEGMVRISDISMRVYKQSFDTVFLRLHLRSLKDGVPSEELLTENIYLPVYTDGGWQTFNLSDYHITAHGKVALSLEWVRISGVNEKKLVKMNKDKEARAVILFNLNKKGGKTVIRRGSEARWKVVEGESPAFYIGVLE